MKTPCTLLQTSAGLIASGVLIATAWAGPGSNYWRDSVPTGRTTPPAAAVPNRHMIRDCTDSRLVSVMETRPILPNGRGPIRTTVVGQKRTCFSCGTPSIAMKPSWPNARGPLVPVTIPAPHDCTDACVLVAAAH
jgi:hypothetical protein